MRFTSYNFHFIINAIVCVSTRAKLESKDTKMVYSSSDFNHFSIQKPLFVQTRKVLIFMCHGIRSITKWWFWFVHFIEQKKISSFSAIQPKSKHILQHDSPFRILTNVRYSIKQLNRIIETDFVKHISENKNGCSAIYTWSYVNDIVHSKATVRTSFTYNYFKECFPGYFVCKL